MNIRITLEEILEWVANDSNHPSQSISNVEMPIHFQFTGFRIQCTLKACCAKGLIQATVYQ